MPAPAFPARHHRSGSSGPDPRCPLPLPPQAPRSGIHQAHRIRQARRTVTLRHMGLARCPLPGQPRIPHPHHRRRGSPIPAHPAWDRSGSRMSWSRPGSRMYPGSPGQYTAPRQWCPALPQAPARLRVPVRTALLRRLRIHLLPARRNRRILPRTHPGTRIRLFPCMPRSLPLRLRRRQRSVPLPSPPRHPRRTWSLRNPCLQVRPRVRRTGYRLPLPVWRRKPRVPRLLLPFQEPVPVQVPAQSPQRVLLQPALQQQAHRRVPAREWLQPPLLPGGLCGQG